MLSSIPMYSLFISVFLFQASSAVTPRFLPSTILAAYPGGGCSPNSTVNVQVIEAVENGVNVVIWDFIALASNLTTGLPIVSGGPPLECVVGTVKMLEEAGLVTTHMISIGGWDTPHPTTNNPVTGQPYTAQQVYDAWNEWNMAGAEQYNWQGYDGFDWDLEGADDPSSPTNVVTVACLNLMGEMSQLAKSDGYIVSMVPCESYLDPTTANFSMSLLLNYPEWLAIGVNCTCHGNNPYAYLTSRFGQAVQNNETVLTFDFATVQFYETYSHAEFNITINNQSAADYFVNITPRFLNGWWVDFDAVPELDWPSQFVSINTTQLVFGLANGWSGTNGNLLVMPQLIGQAFSVLKARGIEPRGVGFWDVSDEGDVPSGQSAPLYLAAGLNQFLHTRP